jgi:hypothetical protein
MFKAEQSSKATTCFWTLLAALLICGSLLGADRADRKTATPVAVRFREGSVHGFLVLSAMDETPLAEGDLTQVPQGDRITSHLIFRFKDGSLNEETTVFSQRGNFRLLSYHQVQKGPSFPHPVDVTITPQQVAVHYREENGEEKDKAEHVDLQANTANGVMLTMVKNIRPGTSETRLSMVAITPKPRMVNLQITAVGEEPFSIAGSNRNATHYVVKIEIPGVAGVVAPLVGKKPPDINIWMLGGEAPTFVKSEGPLYYGGPIWRIELTSPVWPRS